MSWSKRTRHAVVGMAAVVATAAGLAGCSGDPGAAAVVDGAAIKSTSVGDAVDDLSAIGVDWTADQTLVNLIQLPTYVEVARNNGIGASDEECIELLNKLAEQNKATPPATFHPATIDVARLAVLYQAMGSSANSAEIGTELQQGLESIDVELSPRVGVLDMATWSISPMSFDWISRPGA